MDGLPIGNPSPFKGKIHSEETKRKISENQKVQDSLK